MWIYLKIQSPGNVLVTYRSYCNANVDEPFFSGVKVFENLYFVLVPTSLRKFTAQSHWLFTYIRQLKTSKLRKKLLNRIAALAHQFGDVHQFVGRMATTPIHSTAFLPQN